MRKIHLSLLILTLTFFGCQTKSIQVHTLKLKGSESMFEPFRALIRDFESIQDSVKLTLEGGGSRTALPAVAKEEVHIGLSSYPFNLDEVLGVSHGISELVVAYDGIVIISNESNPIDQLTNEQITGIYNGTITDWSQLGGDSGAIKPIIRNQNSGTQKFFTEHFSLGTISENALVMDKNNHIVSQVNKDSNSIGFIGFAHVTVNVKDLKVPSAKFSDDSMFVYPSSRSISEGHYPLKRALRIYYKGEGDYATKAFIAYLKSQRGSEVLEKHGLIANTSSQSLARS